MIVKMLNCSGPSIDAGGISLVTSFQLKFEPLTTTLWAQQSSPFFNHVALNSSSSHLFSLAISILWKAELKVFLQINYICNSPFIHRDKLFHHRRQSGRSRWFNLDKSVLADSSHPSVFHVPEMRGNSFHNSPRSWPGFSNPGLPSWLFKIMM